jgi:S1-C subfamily serine protease
VTSNNTLSNSNNNLVSEASDDESKNLTVSLPMTTSTSHAQGTHRLDAIRSVHNEQKTIEEENLSLNSSDETRAPGANNEKFSYSKPTNSNKAYSPNDSSGVPPVNNNGAAATANGGSGKKSNGFVFVVAFAGALLACILAFAVGSFFGLFGSKTVIGGTSTTLGSTSSSTIDASDTSANLAEAVSSKCLPSVVSINVYGTTTTSTGSIFDYFNGNSGSDEQTETQTATGSGVVISKDGYIITNEHVTEDGTRYEVNVNGKTLEAKLVGADSSSDVAVLKVDTDEELTAIELGDSDTIKTGEWVMSIGSPFGLEQSVATGIVSATSRSQIASSDSSSSSSSSSVRIYPNMVQTDAAINPGNSGGALVNENGQLIGINTLIQSSSGNYSGVGFAIPVNYAIGIARDLIEGKTPTYAQLGVSCTSITETIAKRYGFGVSSGAYVSEVTSGSGADNAGIKKGDIITEFEGEEVTSSSDLTLDVRKKNAGDKVSVKIVRDGSEQTLEVTLGQSSSSTSTNSNSNSQNQQNQNSQGLR